MLPNQFLHWNTYKSICVSSQNIFFITCWKILMKDEKNAIFLSELWICHWEKMQHLYWWYFFKSKKSSFTIKLAKLHVQNIKVLSGLSQTWTEAQCELEDVGTLGPFVNFVHGWCLPLCIHYPLSVHKVAPVGPCVVAHFA